MFLGCGFLASHIIPFILPHASEIILIDGDKIERGNYESSIFPKGYEGKRKVSALAALIQVLSSVTVVPRHLHVKKASQLIELHKRFKPDFVFVTFDNIESRLMAKGYIMYTATPSLFVGVTENHVYIDWGEWVMVPVDPGKITKVRKELEKIRDVCSRLEFRGLGLMAAAYTYYAFKQWLEKNVKTAFIIDLKDKVHVAQLKRDVNKYGKKLRGKW